MEVSDQLYVPAILPQGKEPPAPTGGWTFRRRESSFTLHGKRNTYILWLLAGQLCSVSGWQWGSVTAFRPFLLSIQPPNRLVYQDIFMALGAIVSTKTSFKRLRMCGAIPPLSHTYLKRRAVAEHRLFSSPSRTIPLLADILLFSFCVRTRILVGFADCQPSGSSPVSIQSWQLWNLS
jgi:hypothetical protein